MQTDPIEAVGIDQGGSLWVKPATAAFPYIYREAMEVHWDAERLRLYAPKPRERTYAVWFRQIIDAARQQGVALELARTTVWSDIDAELQRTIADGG